MARVRRPWVRLALGLLGVAATCAPAQDIDAGYQLYALGRTAAGPELRARVNGDTLLSGQAAACTNCHRPSGLGTFEGIARSLPITGPVLFADRPPPAARPAYDEQSLWLAITRGIRPGGQPLDPLMPRYDLTRQDAADLVRYLRQLGATAAPGVTDEEIVLATIVADAAPEGQRRAVSQVLQRFVQIKNAGSRHEGRRATIARRHAFGERHDRAYRRWRLLRWELHGAPETWPKQLEALYAADPPFLVVSGTAGEHWAVVHEFCEQRRMPCVLPLTDEPASGPAPFYSLYFHEGVRLEARVTARHIRRKRTHDTARVLIVRPDTPKARAAADTLRLALAADGADGSALVQERVLPPSAQTNAAYWRNVLHANPADALVTWIDRGQLTGLPEALADFPAAPAVYTAAAFLGPQSAPPLHGVPRTWHVQPFRYAPAERVAYTREAEWLRAQGLSGLDPLPASQALFACHIVGEQLSAIVGNFSREYFLEGLEHMLDGTDMTSLLPATTLGQGQRFISRGAYVLATATSQGVAAEPEWIEQ